MDIPKVGKDNKKIAVIGGGKTGADAVVHLVRSGIKKENIVWVKKYDLAFGKREKPQDAFASAEQRAANPLCPLLVTSHSKFANGVPKFWSLKGRGGSRRIGYTVLPKDHPENTSPYLNHTGGGMLDDEELDLLRQIEQVVVFTVPIHEHLQPQPVTFALSVQVEPFRVLSVAALGAQHLNQVRP